MHRVRLARCDYIIIRLILLLHQPHRFDVFFGVAPVSLAAQVTQIKILLQACLDAGRGASNLAGDEGLSAAGRFMVEQYAIGREYSGGASISGTR